MSKAKLTVLFCCSNATSLIIGFVAAAITFGYLASKEAEKIPSRPQGSAPIVKRLSLADRDPGER